MNYKESKLILEKIKKAKRILVNCHERPDGDSVGSALAMSSILEGMGKKVEVVYPHTSYDIPKIFYFLDDVKKIQKIDFKTFDFSGFDLFMSLDTSSWDRVCGYKDFKNPVESLIVIDHHTSNVKYGDVNLVDAGVSSTAEIVYKIFEDCELEISKKTAMYLLMGIITDTGAFSHPKVLSQTFIIVQRLMELGADKDLIIREIFRSQEFNLLKFWGEVLTRLEIDESRKFVWSAIPNEVFIQLGRPSVGKETSASLFSSAVEGTDFGIIMVQEKIGELQVSFRSRTGFDTSKIAIALGGGGHIYASGASVKGLPFDEAVQKVLQTARKFAKENAK